MKNCDPQSLRNDFIQVVRETLEKPEIADRIRIFAGTYNSFEHWLNWELLYAFQAAYPWPSHSGQREMPYPNPTTGLADIAVSYGEVIPNDENCIRIESKLIWDNVKANKYIESSVRDAKRIELVGIGVLVIVAISAGKKIESQSWPHLLCGSPVTLLEQLHSRLQSSQIPTEGPDIVFQYDVSSDSSWIDPQIRIAIYRVG